MLKLLREYLTSLDFTEARKAGNYRNERVLAKQFTLNLS
jgi:hypothetical protein